MIGAAPIARHTWRLPRVLLPLLLCALIAPSGSPERVRYDGYAAVLVETRDAAEMALVRDLARQIWSDPVPDRGPVVAVLGAPEIALLAARGIPYRIEVADIQAVADAERARLASRVHAASAAEFFAEYRDVQEIHDFVDQLAERHPYLAGVRRLGTSIDGWPIRAVEISRGGPIHIALNGGQHAREWISVMVTACIADRLASESTARISRILDRASFFITPLVNPDGYLHSWNVDRYWRKNRRGGHGVDLNRNYSVGFGGRGSSGRRRSDIYRGEHAFSEPETQAMRRLFVDEDIAAHVDFHSYSQLILYPWSYQGAPPPDRAEHAAVADKMASAIAATHGERYRIGAAPEILYAAGGTMSDWAYGEGGAMSFTVELRPPMGRGGGGFVLPPEQIVPTCDESLAAVLELAEWVTR